MALSETAGKYWLRRSSGVQPEPSPVADQRSTSMARLAVLFPSGICAGISGIAVTVPHSVLSLCCFAVSRTCLPPTFLVLFISTNWFCCLVPDAGTYFVMWREKVMAIYCLCLASTVFVSLFAFSWLWKHEKKILLSTLTWRWSHVSAVLVLWANFWLYVHL